MSEDLGIWSLFPSYRFIDSHAGVVTFVIVIFDIDFPLLPCDIDVCLGDSMVATSQRA